MSNLGRIRFLCRRGLKELDIIFESYIKNHLEQANAEELQQLETLLKMDDQSLLLFIMNPPSDISAETRDLCLKLSKVTSNI